jgi:hypothetical protein
MGDIVREVNGFGRGVWDVDASEKGKRQNRQPKVSAQTPVQMQTGTKSKTKDANPAKG